MWPWCQLFSFCVWELSGGLDLAEGASGDAPRGGGGGGIAVARMASVIGSRETGDHSQVAAVGLAAAYLCWCGLL